MCNFGVDIEFGHLIVWPTLFGMETEDEGQKFSKTNL